MRTPTKARGRGRTPSTGGLPGALAGATPRKKKPQIETMPYVPSQPRNGSTVLHPPPHTPTTMGGGGTPVPAGGGRGRQGRGRAQGAAQAQAGKAKAGGVGGGALAGPGGRQLESRVQSGKITQEQAQRTMQQRQTLKKALGSDWRSKLQVGGKSFAQVNKGLAKSPGDPKLAALRKKLIANRSSVLTGAHSKPAPGSGGTEAPTGKKRGKKKQPAGGGIPGAGE